MSDLVEFLHAYVDQYDRLAEDLEQLQLTIDRLRLDVSSSQRANRGLVKEVGALKEAQPVYRTKHDYVLLASVVLKAERALRAVKLTNQSEETVALVAAALTAMEKL